MARGAAEGADDGLGAEFLAGVADAARALGQVHPVEPVAGGESDVILDHHGDVAGVGDLAGEVGDAGQFGLVAGAREAQAGDGVGVEHCGQAGREFRGRQAGRGDEVKLRGVLGHLRLSCRAGDGG